MAKQPPKKVLVVYNHEDEGLARIYFIKFLKDVCNAQCYTDNDFEAGKTKINGIVETIKECQKTFVIITKSSLEEKEWISYNILLALEKSQRSRHLSVTLFLFDVTKTDVQCQLCGILSDAMIVEVDTNKNDWEKQLKQNLETKLKDESPVCGINRAANLAVGQAWSHFTGYGRIVLPRLREKITKSQLYRQNPGRFPLVEFNILPNSARSVKLLKELDERIEHEGVLETITANRGSFQNRPYDVPIYSIKDEHGQKYYFVGQIPNTLSILEKLEHPQDDWCQKNKRPDLTAGERSLQVARFGYMYNRLVNHTNSTGCTGMVVIVPFDDSKENVGDILLKSIKKALSDETPSTLTDKLKRMELDVPSSKVHACVIHSEEDHETASEIRKCLEANNFEVFNTQAGKTEIQNLEEALKKCKWLIFVMSENSIISTDFPLLHFKFRCVLTQCVEENELRVIPVADGLSEDQITYDLHAVTYLKKQEHYLENILKIIKCESIRMDYPVTAEDVHHGLAWAYVLNYLIVTLNDREKQFQHIKNKKPNCKLYEKRILLVHSSCATKDLGSLDKNDKGEALDSDFTQDEVIYNERDVGGMKNRKYQMVTYKVTTQKQTLIVAVEYPNALICLREMADLHILSGLSQETLPEESRKFYLLVKDILPRSSVADKAEVVYYDDSRYTVREVIKDHCLKDV